MLFALGAVFLEDLGKLRKNGITINEEMLA